MVTFTETESREEVPRGWRRRGWEMFNGCGVSSWEDEKVLEMLVVKVALGRDLMPLNCTLKKA